MSVVLGPLYLYPGTGKPNPQSEDRGAQNQNKSPRSSVHAFARTAVQMVPFCSLHLDCVPVSPLWSPSLSLVTQNLPGCLGPGSHAVI